MRRCTLRNARGILAETHVAPIMHAVLYRGPVISDRFEQFVIVVFRLSDTGCIVADFVAGFFRLRAQVHAFTAYRNDLPAAAQADLLRGDGYACQSTAFEAPMISLPFHRFIRGEKPAVEAGARRDQEFRFGFPLIQTDSPNRTPESSPWRFPAGSASHQR